MPALRHLIAVPLFVLTPWALATETPRKQWLADIGDGYQSLANRAAELQRVAEDYCAVPGTDGRTQVETAWKEAFLDWQAVRFVDFGPIEQHSRAWQIQFWPDSKNLVARKVGFALDQSAITQQQIDEAGVALQGFPALEYLLFDSRMGQSEQALPADQTCQLLTAIAGHLETTTANLAEDWQHFAPHYLSMESYTARTVEAGLNGLEILQARRLAEPMGLRNTKKRNPYLGDAWRSGHSLAAIGASVDGLYRYLYPGLKTLLRQHNKPELAERLAKQFDSTLEELNALPDALAPSLEDDEKYRELQSLFIEITQLEQVLANRVAPALGISRGFNSSDGD
ncbi:imelysin family protein [Marinobacter fonticola]|uniref:imelysin family protein n=1 Tax=Marinobacter fonticola TaxID=2603215 RepID=UPI0011E61F0D|nr:imelysin family protein [Marinobacter fonticola]